MILLIKIVQLLFNLILLQQDLTLGGIAMKFKKTQDEFDGKLTSLSQKVGVSIIGLLTALGTGLIIYTGVMAATYNVAQQENQYLTYEDALKNGQSFGVTSEEGLQKPNESFVVNDYVDDYLDVILDENGKVVGVENKVILDVYRDGKDISDNYEIEYNYGELVITQQLNF